MPDVAPVMVVALKVSDKLKSKFTTIFKQQLESIQLMSKLLTNILAHQALWIIFIIQLNQLYEGDLL